MDFAHATHWTSRRITIENHLAQLGQQAIIDSILLHLQNPPRSISSMFFYDALGSHLFEEITRLPEYYQSRTEKQLLEQFAREKAASCADMDIVELGSGDCSKISILLNHIDSKQLQSIRYVPLDVSQEALQESARRLIDRYPQLTIAGVVADFISQLHVLPSNRRRLICFFGSTIGNLSSQQRSSFLDTIAKTMHDEDRLLLGVDLVKDQSILERAYNDSQQLTAAFNRNILFVVNRLSRTDFNADHFNHVACYNQEVQCIEMFLEADRDLCVSSPHLSQAIPLVRGERIHTENSYKFSLHQLQLLLSITGLGIEEVYIDSSQWFALLLIAPKDA